jgi:hypothetical protein
VIDLRNVELLAPHSLKRFEPALESDNPSLGRTEGSALARVADGFKPVHGLLECFDLLVDRCSRRKGLSSSSSRQFFMAKWQGYLAKHNSVRALIGFQGLM